MYYTSAHLHSRIAYTTWTKLFMNLNGNVSNVSTVDLYLLVSCNVAVQLWCQIFGARVRVDAVSKVAELELAEKEKMKAKVEKILKHNISVFINR